MRYLIYGLSVESEVSLTSVEKIADTSGSSDITIVIGSEEYFHEATSGIPLDEEDWIQQATLADGSIYVRAEGVFQTVVSRDGRQAICGRLGSTDDLSFEANLLNFVVSTALTLQGEESLHATVVDLGGRVIGLLGHSGAGKSSLAAYFVARGASLITDDMLRVVFAGDRAFACPGPYRLKLFDEPARLFLPNAVRRGTLNALSGKYMVEPGPRPLASRHRQPLTALFWLGGSGDRQQSGQITVARMTGAELARSLISSAMNIRYHAPERLVRQLRFSEKIARSLPVHAVIYPRRFDMMGRVGEEILRATQS